MILWILYFKILILQQMTVSATILGSSCFSDSNYCLTVVGATSLQMNYESALFECRATGGNLSDMKNNLTYQRYLDVRKSGLLYWFSLNDAALDGVYKWHNGDLADLESFNLFSSGQPNDSGMGPNDQQCTVLENDEWNDWWCEEELDGYLCNNTVYEVNGFVTPTERSFRIVKFSKKSWQAANETCGSMNMRMATLEDRTVFNIVAPSLEQSAAHYWIGLTDLHVPGVLRWEDERLYESYGPWKEPLRERCATITKSGEIALKDCQDSSDGDRFFICEENVPSEGRCTKLADGCGDVENDRSFIEYCFIKSDTSMPWPDAMDYCISRNFSLALVFDMQTSLQLQSMRDTEDSWIGLSNIGNDFVKRWSDGRVLAWSHWSTYKLDKAANQCTAIGSSGWIDYNCSDLKPVFCEKLRENHCPTIRNSTMTLYSYPWINYTCPDGHYLLGGLSSKLISCNCSETVHQADLELFHGTCSPVECPLLTVNFATVVYRSRHYPIGFLSANCNVGHSTTENVTSIDLSCSTRGDWLNRIGAVMTSFNCTKISCGLLPTKPNVNRDNNQTLYGAAVTFTCDQGYSIRDGVFAVKFQCEADHRWREISQEGFNSYDNVACTEMDCLNPKNLLDNGTVAYHQTVYGSLGNLSCYEGYELAKDIVTTFIFCGNSSKWILLDTFLAANYTDLACHRVSCAAMPAVINGQVSLSGSFYGDVASLTCDDGHEFDDQTSVKQAYCSSKAAWLLNGSPVDLLTCQRRSCGPLPLNISGATVNTTGHLYQDIISVTCDHLHAMENGETHRQIYCTQNAVWYHALSNFDLWFCRLLDCGVPTFSLSGANLLLQETTVGETALVKCYTGYHTADGVSSQTIQCNKSLQWEIVGNSLSAKEIEESLICYAPPRPLFNGTVPPYCPEVPYLPNTIKVNDVHDIGEYVTFTCEAGFVFPSGGTTRTVVCLEDATWSAQIVQCITSACNQPVASANMILQPDESQWGMNGVVHGICSPGFRFANGHDSVPSQCSSQNSWSHLWTDCKEDRCVPLPFSEQSRPLPYSTDAGFDVMMICDPGHRLATGQSSYSASCAANTEWTELSWLPCIVDVCAPLVPPVNGYINTSLSIYNTPVLVSCLEGFMFPDANVTMALRCLAAEVWSDHYSDCQIIDCGSPSNIAGAETLENSTSTIYGSTRIVMCHPGLRLPDGRTSLTQHCGLSRTWEPDLSNCLATRCPPVPLLDNAIANSQLAEAGSVVAYTCMVGYKWLDGSTLVTAHCTGGHWKYDTNSPCTIMTCPSLDNLFLSYDVSQLAYRQFGTRLNVTCDLGRIANTSRTRSFTVACGKDGRWKGLEGCERVSCGALPIMTTAISVATSSKYLDIALFRCLPGMWFKRDVFEKKVICTSFGVWLPQLTECTVVKCAVLETWTSLHANSTSSSYGSAVNVSCGSKEQILKGNLTTVTLTCTERGFWQPSAPKCIEKPLSATVIPTTEATGATTIGTTVTAIIGACLVTIFLLDIPNLKAHLSQAFQDVFSS